MKHRYDQRNLGALVQCAGIVCCVMQLVGSDAFVMDSSKVSPPRQRLQGYKLIDSTSELTGWKLSRREAQWRRAYKATDNEERLSSDGVAFIDLMNAFTRVVNCRESARCQAYATIAAHVSHMDDDAIRMWHTAVEAEYERLRTTKNADEFRRSFKRSIYYNYFADESRAFREVYYFDVKENAVMFNNVIRLASAKNRNGDPLILEESQQQLLYPHYSIYRAMSPLELKEALGVLRLHYAWKTHNDSEQQKVKRFVAAHVDEMDSAIAIVESRFVDSLDHLDALLAQSSSPALMDGAL